MGENSFIRIFLCQNFLVYQLYKLKDKQMAIPKIYKHGIEIIKPWSKEMYDYNESIKAIMINEIKF